MEPLDIKATNDTPRVVFDPDNDLFEISGRSLPEDVVSFYQPVIDWLDHYKTNPLPKTEFIFKYIYFNTATSKLVQDILFRLEGLRETGHEVNIFWYYEQDDEDMYDMGLEFKENINLPFEIIAY
jgi:hypothetical protein